MTSHEIIARIEAGGGVLIPRGGNIAYKLPPDMPPAEIAALVEELRVHKAEILALLRQRQTPSTGTSVWPLECYAARERFGQAAAFLFPLIGHRVQTSRGPGRLEQVFAGRCTVVLDAEPEGLAIFRPEEIGLPA